MDLVLQREFLRHPTRIDTVTGSSAAVVAEMVARRAGAAIGAATGVAPADAVRERVRSASR